MRRAVIVAVTACTASAWTACAAVLGIEDRFYDGPEASPDAAAPNDAGARADEGAPDAPCPPDMVAAGVFCIDATEVTQRRYAEFVVAMDGGLGEQPPSCAWNDASVAPPGSCSGFALDPGSTKPMACVDWCDAVAYCAWRGKRLCGLVGGGAVPADASPALWETTSDQWFAACSNLNDGFHAYPYGNDYDAHACNGADYGAGTTVPVGSIATCAGGVDGGLWDMSGNVWEWEDSCQPSTQVEGGVECLKRGGGYPDPGWAAYFNLACRARYFNDRTTLDPQLGFRCCSL